MWRYAFVVLLVFSAGLAITQTAQHGDRPPGRKDHDPPLNAKPLIEHCRAISRELRSTQKNSPAARRAVNTAWCLDKEIIRHASTLKDHEAFARPPVD